MLLLVAPLELNQAVAQVKLADLPALARARAAARRPALEAALAPFLDDLALEYSSNKSYLVERLEAVAQLGSGVAPLLLERLTPPDDTKEALHRAENSCRVLEQLDPAAFETALVELLAGESATARRSAIVLLAGAGTPGAARALAARVATLTPIEHRAMAVEALAEIGDPSSESQVLPLLMDSEEGVRSVALRWVDRAGSMEPAVRDALLAGLKRERVPGLMPRFARALSRRTKDDGEVADAIRPRITDTRLSRPGLHTMLMALGAVAPEGHEATLAALKVIVERDTGSTGLAAATAMRQLGDRKGLETMYDSLSKAIKDNRQSGELYARRGAVMLASEQLSRAASDYEKADRFSRSSRMRRLAQRELARIDARRSKWTQMLRRLRDLQPTRAEYQAWIAEDDAFRTALENTRIREFVDGQPAGQVRR